MTSLQIEEVEAAKMLYLLSKHFDLFGLIEKGLALDAKKVKDRPKCKCGVPLDVHGTCCEWYCAKISVSPDGKIIDEEHPEYGKNYNEWMSQRFK